VNPNHPELPVFPSKNLAGVLAPLYFYVDVSHFAPELKHPNWFIEAAYS